MYFCDGRETKETQRKLRKYYPDLVVQNMDIGDFTGKDVCVESKTSTDFAASIRDGRLASQALGMSTYFKNPVVIIEGTYEQVRQDHYCNVSINEYIGAMTDLVMLYKIPIIPCENRSQYARICDSLIRKSGGETPSQKLTRMNKWKGNQELSCLLGIYGLGEKRARAILKQFTFRELCDASVKDLMSVKGIGNKYAKAIKEVFK